MSESTGFGTQLRKWLHDEPTTDPQTQELVRTLLARFPEDKLRMSGGQYRDLLDIVWELQGLPYAIGIERLPNLAWAAFVDGIELTRFLESKLGDAVRFASAALLTDLGTLQCQMGQILEAQSTLVGALGEWGRVSEDTGFAEFGKVMARLNLGVCYQKLGNLEDAASQYEDCCQRLRERIRPGTNIRETAALISALCNLSAVTLELAMRLQDSENTLDSLQSVRPDLAREIERMDFVHSEALLKKALIFADEAIELCQAQGKANRTLLSSMLNAVNTRATVQLKLDNPYGARETLRLGEEWIEVTGPGVSSEDELLIGRTYQRIAVSCIRLDRKQEAIQYSTQAVSMFERHASYSAVDDYCSCLVTLGELLLNEFDSQPESLLLSRDALRKGVRFLELLREQRLSSLDRDRFQHEFLKGYELLVASIVEIYKLNRSLGSLGEAITVADLVKARRINDDLSNSDSRLRTVRELIRREQSRLPNHPVDYLTSRSTEDQLKEVQQRLKLAQNLEYAARFPLGKGTLQEIPSHPEVDQPFEPANYAKIQQPRNSDIPVAFIDFFFLQSRTIAFVLGPDNSIQLAHFPKLTEHRAVILANIWNIVHQYARDPSSAGPQEMCKLLNDFLDYWEVAVDEPLRLLTEAIRNPGWRWGAFMEDFLKILANEIFTPLIETQWDVTVRRLVFIPHRSLHGLPIHACPMVGEVLLPEDYDFAYTPSLSIYANCRSQKQERDVLQLLLLQDPTYDLPLAKIEADLAELRFDKVRRWNGNEITSNRVLQDSDDVDVIHYIGHAYFDDFDPLASALVLYNRTNRDKWLTTSAISSRGRFLRAPLVILSGCETAMMTVNPLDNFDSLALSFLSAGASAVVSSMWRVHDVAAILVIGRMYQELADGNDLGVSLAKAQEWLRLRLTSNENLETVLLNDETSPIHIWINKSGSNIHRAVINFAREAQAEPIRHWAPFVVIGDPGFRLSRKQS